MRKLGVLLVAVGLVAGACSSDGGSTSTSTTKADASADDVAPGAVAKEPSAGCDSSAATAAGQTKVTTTFDGTERWWFQDVPPQHDGALPLPLVMDLHGYSEGAEIHLQMSNLAEYGTEQGFVTVTPQGLGAVARWDTTLGSSDLKFLGEVLDQTEATLCVDTNRVYVTGLSNGAFMTSAMVCEYSDRIAAVAPVAGVRIIDGCEITRPVPVAAFHGTADTFVTYDGGLGEGALNLPAPDGSGRTLGETLTPEQLQSRDASTSVPTIMDEWAKRNGCAKGTKETEITAEVTRIAWDCPPTDATILYRVTGGGHSWPGSKFSMAIENIVGPTNMDISANELMWNFFIAHPLRPE